MPRGAQIIKVAMQMGAPTIWAIVDPNADRELRNFFVVGTGLELPAPGGTLLTKDYYVGTVFDESYVWHIFEMPR